MSTPILGKPLADTVTKDVKAALAVWQQEGFQPHLVSVLASDDPASRVYVQSKARRAGQLGVRFTVRDLGAELGPELTQDALNAELRTLSERPDVQGIVLELPLAAGPRPRPEPAASGPPQRCRGADACQPRAGHGGART